MIFTHKSKAMSMSMSKTTGSLRPDLSGSKTALPEGRDLSKDRWSSTLRHTQTQTHRNHKEIVQLPKPTPQEVKAKAKPMRWGAPTWIFFHTLAEKVSEEHFALIRKPLLNMVSNICANLPCPDCAGHAREYMSKINFNAIQTKRDFINLFYVFHNTVNERKGFPIESPEILSTYANYNLVAVISNFIYFFENKHMSPRLMADDFMRRQVSASVKQWLSANIQYFA